MRVTWTDDLKADLRRWHGHHELAIARGRIDAEATEYAERLVESWKARIESKYDPDERREWTEPCPAVLERDARTDEAHRCGARRVHLGGTVRNGIRVGGTLEFAISLNVTRLEAECRSCGTRWEGGRELRMLRYETNLAEAERLVEEAAASAGRELTSTGPIPLS